MRSLWHCAASIQRSFGIGRPVVDGMTMLLICGTNVMSRLGRVEMNATESNIVRCVVVSCGTSRGRDPTAVIFES